MRPLVAANWKMNGLGTSLAELGKLKDALADVRQVVHSLLQKKREKEPDPVEPEPVAEGADAGQGGEEGADGVPAASGSLAAFSSAEPTDRRQAVASIAGAASFLRKREPFSPAPYLLLRGLNPRVLSPEQVQDLAKTFGLELPEHEDD